MSRSLCSMASRLRPTCMSAAPRRPGLSAVCRSADSKVCCASRRRPWVIWMSARASEQPITSGEVVAELEAGDRLGVAHRVRRSRSPRLQCARPSSAAAAPRCRWSSAPARSRTRSGMLDGAVGVAGEAGPVRLDARQPWRADGRYATSSNTIGESSRIEPGVDDLEQRIEAVGVAGRHAGARRVPWRAPDGRRTGRRAGLRASSAAATPGAPAASPAQPVRSAPRPARVVAGEGVDDRFTRARRRRRTSHSPGGAARRPGRAARRAVWRAATSPKRWWYRYQVRRSSSGTRNRFDRSSSSRMALASSWPVTAAHSGPVSRLEDRRVEQEVADAGGLAIEDLVGEVVEDEPVVAGELADERRRVVSALHRQRSELQGGDPALGTGFEHVDVGRRQGQLHRAVQVGRQLRRG